MNERTNIMINQVRLDQPFTLPRDLKDLTRKHLKILYPYFHKHIIDTDKKIHNTLNVKALSHDEPLSTFVTVMMFYMFNLPFEAYCLVHTKDLEKIKAAGFKTPAKSIFKKQILSRLKTADFSPKDLETAEKLIDEYRYPYEIDFFLPYDDKFLDPENRLYWNTTTINKIFGEELPEAVTALKQHEEKTCLVKCIIRLNHFHFINRDEFIIEVIKHFTYQLISDYDYPIKFNTTTTKPITATHILDVKEI